MLLYLQLHHELHDQFYILSMQTLHIIYNEFHLIKPLLLIFCHHLILNWKNYLLLSLDKNHYDQILRLKNFYILIYNQKLFRLNPILLLLNNLLLLLLNNHKLYPIQMVRQNLVIYFRLSFFFLFIRLLRWGLLVQVFLEPMQKDHKSQSLYEIILFDEGLFRMDSLIAWIF